MDSTVRKSRRRVRETSDSDDRPRTLRVLVVDHEPEVRATLKDQLETKGFMVALAATVEDVLQIEPTSFDVVVLDLKMRGVRTDVLFFARHRWGSVPLVLLGGAAGPLARATARRWGAVACLPKPVPVADLVDVLQGLLAPSPGGPPARATVLQQPDQSRDPY
jgi:DNA-binding response OmpR family regulator